LPELLRFVLVEVGAAELRHHHERTVEQLLVEQCDDDVVGIAFLVEMNAGLRQLAEACREVLVRAWIVDEPAAAIAFGAVAKTDAAEAERAVVLRARGIAGAP